MTIKSQCLCIRIDFTEIRYMLQLYALHVKNKLGDTHSNAQNNAHKISRAFWDFPKP